MSAGFVCFGGPSATACALLLGCRVLGRRTAFRLACSPLLPSHSAGRLASNLLGTPSFSFSMTPTSGMLPSWADTSALPPTVKCSLPCCLQVLLKGKLACLSDSQSFPGCSSGILHCGERAV